jgi:hypothetical protein
MILVALLWAHLWSVAAQPANLELSRLLPQSQHSPGRSQLLFTENGNRTRFVYTGPDGVIEYCLQPGQDFWGSVIVKVNRIPVVTILDGSAPRFDSDIEEVKFLRRWAEGETLHAEWAIRLKGREQRLEGYLRLLGKTLAVEFSSPGAPIFGASLGPIDPMAGMEARAASPGEDRGCPARLVTLTGIKTIYVSIIPGGGNDWVEETGPSAPSGTGEAASRLTTLRFANAQSGPDVRFFLTLSPAREEVLPAGCQPDSN